MDSSNYPLPKHLAELAHQWQLIKEGQRSYKGIKVTGWWLLTGLKELLFLLDEHSRNTVKTLLGETVKYLHPAGKGLTPVLLAPEEGVVDHQNIR